MRFKMPTQKFKWIDRDTAAKDLLLVAYHAPPSVGSRALSLLRSIRSASIIPELTAIAHDESRDIWERRYALRAINAVPRELDMSQIAQRMEEAFLKRSQAYERGSASRGYISDMSADFLDEIISIVDKHPTNRTWFLDVLNRVNEPIIVHDYVTNALHYELSDDFRRLLFDLLIAQLVKQPDLLTLDTVRPLYIYGRAFLNSQLNRIVEMCLSSEQVREWLPLAIAWNELREALVDLKPETETRITLFNQEWDANRNNRELRKQQELQSIQQNPIYQFLFELYEAAQHGDKTTYDKLRRIANKWDGNIPLRAVATHFIGKLMPKYDSLNALQYLLKHADDNWGEPPYHSPIRFEAGEALMLHPSLDVWESLVDAFFIDPQNILSNFMQSWIEHVTDALSGDQHDYKGSRWGGIDNRGWFYALNELDVTIVDQYR